jgi:hypothetical protein
MPSERALSAAKEINDVNRIRGHVLKGIRGQVADVMPTDEMAEIVDRCMGEGWISALSPPDTGREVLTLTIWENAKVYLIASYLEKSWFDEEGGECDPALWRELPAPPSGTRG